MADALVAVTVLSSALVLVLAAVQMAGRVSRAAVETRQADLLLRERIEATRGQLGVWAGEAPFPWRVEARMVGEDRSGLGGPCMRRAEARPRDEARPYVLETLDTCIDEAARGG
ncbi:hypothetical protein [Caulobacter endophyticus]|uniref:Uncharacterized protein n=1 Tax=Caulobacter endophyticus TaxID=2172652 RepID=A0A2T9JMM1_9CAUL|nr:hypothetical protein [Caulobacter endophyticus]PVM84914.1 hypothetical protein DDF67_18640 [Caulobacter endophyticus]